MKKNIGGLDRILRIIIATIIVVLYFMEILTAAAGIVFMVIAAILLITSLAGRCALYVPLGINTCPKDKEDLN